MKEVEKYIEIAYKGLKEKIESCGARGKEELIRSSGFINNFHNLVKEAADCKAAGRFSTHPNKDSLSELTLCGYFKHKAQDICLVPNDSNMQEQIIENDGVLNNFKDIYGQDYTEKVISINVRSSLSSISKNFDTLFERTYAEALNLHLRCPKMVLGEVFVLPAFELDVAQCQNKSVSFLRPNNQSGQKRKNNRKGMISKYIWAFNSINNRKDCTKDYFKYEKVALLIVDFENQTVLSDCESLKDKQLIGDNDKITDDMLQALSWDGFLDGLLEIHDSRFKSR